MNQEKVKEMLRQQVREKLERAKTIVEVMAVKSIKKNFEKGGRPNPWKKSKKRGRAKGTKTLVISGTLSNVSASAEQRRESIAITLTTDPRARAYARIQNEGGVINVPAKTKKFRVKRYKDGTKRTVFASSKHKKVIEKKTKAHTIVIPKREYMVIPPEDQKAMVEAVKKA